MNILVTGVKGQLGHDVFNKLKEEKLHNAFGVDFDDLEISNEFSVKSFFQSKKIDAIIHCAAYTAVDSAEDNQDICFDVNVNGTKYLLNEAIKQDAKFIFISTDYVFDGNKQGEYEVDDIKQPNSVYGKTKDTAEQIVLKYNRAFVVRTSWVYGLNGLNFVKTMLNLADKKSEISVVSDQIGSPTYSYDLADLLCDMVNTEKYGIYHATNEGFCSWYEFAKKIFELTGSKMIVKPILTASYPTKASRPKNSRLSKEFLYRNGFEKLPPWKDAIKRYIIETRKLK